MFMRECYEEVDSIFKMFLDLPDESQIACNLNSRLGGMVDLTSQAGFTEWFFDDGNDWSESDCESDCEGSEECNFYIVVSDSVSGDSLACVLFNDCDY